jgi:hypothetical protein
MAVPHCKKIANAWKICTLMYASHALLFVCRIQTEAGWLLAAASNVGKTSGCFPAAGSVCMRLATKLQRSSELAVIRLKFCIRLAAALILKIITF